MSRDLTILVSGLTDPAHIAEVHAMAARAAHPVLIAVAHQPPDEPAGDATCLDLTPHLDFDAAIAACRGSARRGGLVFVREPQLRHKGVARAVRDLELHCIALDADVSYDTDPSWVVAPIEELLDIVTLAYYAIDLFTDVSGSWRFFQCETRPDELTPADLRDICTRFPVLLAADLDPANVADVAAFRGVAGVLLTCDELRPIVPAHRHVLPYAALRETLQALLADGRAAT